MKILQLSIATCFLLFSQVCLCQETQQDSIVNFILIDDEWQQTGTHTYEYYSQNEVRVNYYKIDTLGKREFKGVTRKIFNNNGDLLESITTCYKTVYEYDENFNNTGRYSFFCTEDPEIWNKQYGVFYRDFDEFGNYRESATLNGQNDQNEWFPTAIYSYEHIYNSENLVDSITVFRGQNINYTQSFLYDSMGREIEGFEFYSSDNKIRRRFIKNYSANSLLIDHTMILHDPLNDEYFIEAKLNFTYDEDEKLIQQINQDRFQGAPSFFKYDFYYPVEDLEEIENEDDLQIKWYNSEQGQVEVSIEGLAHDKEYKIQVFNAAGKLVKYLTIGNSETWTGSFRLDSGIYALAIANEFAFLHVEKVFSF